MSKTVLHIHQDYPDNFDYPYTKAVSNLVDAMKLKGPEDIQHYVISINRTANPFKVRCQTFKDGMAFVYWGIPFKFMHVFTLWIAALFIRFVIRNINFDLVHAHKLSTEGVIGERLASWNECPYFISVRGGSDTPNLKRFNVHTSVFRRIFTNASRILWVSPWARSKVENSLNVKLDHVELFPNICEIELDQFDPAELQQKQSLKFLTVVAYRQYERKGLIPLIKAFKKLRQSGHMVELDVYGYGPEDILSDLKNQTLELQAQDFIHFKGQIAQKELREQMKSVEAMLLPSENETFGMSYIEALSVGCPIMYMANTGVDGFFEDYEIGARVKSQDPDELANATLSFIHNREKYHQGLIKLHNTGYLKLFLAETLVSGYSQEIKRLL